MINISVVMAAYNGSKYIKEQIISILVQLTENDELIVSIDPSTDGTEDLVNKLAISDNRITIIKGLGKGVVKNFENALSHSKGRYIFLSDQDDIWVNKKVNKCIRELEEANTLLVMHNYEPVDNELKHKGESFLDTGFSSNIFGNIIRNKYVGCCMAFKKDLLSYCMPFPEKLPMHDQWIGIVAKKLGKVVYLDENLILYRRHNETITGREKSSILTKLKWRFYITYYYIMKRKNK